MSNAEEFAYSKYPKDKKGVLYDLARNSIIQGYHQAEKDLELGWEDMFTIFGLMNKVLDDYADGKTKKEVGEEVLRRFKDFKERKEK